MRELKFVRDHIHAGVLYRAGEKSSFSDHDAETLRQAGAVEPEKQRPAPPPERPARNGGDK